MINDDLEKIGYDEKFERRWGMLEKIYWLLVVILNCAGVAGLLGKGLLSKSKTEDADFMLEYDKVVHYQSATQFDMTIIGTNTNSSAPVIIYLNREITNNFIIQNISPKPSREYLDPTGNIFVFAPSATLFNSKIIFNLEASKVGQINGEVKYNKGPAQKINITILP